MSEATLQRRVLAAIRGAGGHAHKHSDRTPGVPDISYALPGILFKVSGRRDPPQTEAHHVQGWLELKCHLTWTWARHPGTTPRSLGVTPEQLLWARQRIQAGGRVALLAELRGVLWLWEQWPARLDEPLPEGRGCGTVEEVVNQLKEFQQS